MFDLNSPGFWNESALREEYLRVFDICHGCRRCLPLCPSFKTLFDVIDSERVDGEVDKFSARDMELVVDLCYQCKLCFNHCPYVPPHRWEVDFPRLMLRAKAVNARRRGVRFQDRVLGHTDLLGWLGSFMAPLLNWANRRYLNRYLMERTVGIHRKRTLPEYHRVTFEKWFREHSRAEARGGAGRNGRVALFYTCFVNYNDPQLGKDCVAVLEKNGFQVVCPEQRCCGMPFLDGGDITGALRNVKFNLAQLHRSVKEGTPVVIPGPTCSYMLKKEYPFLSNTEEARAVAENSYDISEFLMVVRGRGLLSTDFVKGVGRIAYHVPCHLRAQGIGYKSRDLMALIPGSSVEVIENCSGVDGTWGLKREYFDLSLKVAGKLFRQVEEARADVVASDCPLAAMQVKEGLGISPLHPVQVLKKAYGL